LEVDGSPGKTYYENNSKAGNSFKECAECCKNYGEHDLKKIKQGS